MGREGGRNIEGDVVRIGGRVERNIYRIEG